MATYKPTKIEKYQLRSGYTAATAATGNYTSTDMGYYVFTFSRETGPACTLVINSQSATECLCPTSMRGVSGSETSIWCGSDFGPSDVVNMAASSAM